MDKESEMVRHIRSLDSDMQTLVYENYNKFISATDTIRKVCVLESEASCMSHHCLFHSVFRCRQKPPPPFPTPCSSMDGRTASMLISGLVSGRSRGTNVIFSVDYWRLFLNNQVSFDRHIDDHCAKHLFEVWRFHRKKIDPFWSSFQMKNDFKKMEDEMDHLATNMASITEFSSHISDTLQDRRQHITKLSGVHVLLKKVCQILHA